MGLSAPVLAWVVCGAVLINFAKRRKAIIITTYYTDIFLMKSLKMLNSVTNNIFNSSLVGTHVMLTKKLEEKWNYHLTCLVILKVKKPIN